MSDASPSTSAGDLTVRLRAALLLLNEAIEGARDRIVEGGPDNPAVQRLGGSAMAVPMSELTRMRSWDAFAHDWQAQYKCAAELLERRRFVALRELIETGRFRDGSEGVRRFAPEVIDHIRRIVGDLAGVGEQAPRAPTSKRQRP